MLFKNLNKRTRTILIIQIICLLIGASTHILWILKNGVFSQINNTLLISAIFWDSLTIINILGAILLLIRPKVGIILTMIIITVDVIHNTIYVIHKDVLLFKANNYINEAGIVGWIIRYWMLFTQIIFMIFVLYTFKNNLKEVKLKQISKFS